MRTAFSLLTVALVFAFCSNNKSEEPAPIVKSKTLTVLTVPAEKIIGTYLGDFKGSPIAITINYVGNSHVSGYNVHKGLTRNISGTIEPANGGLHLLLEEPGNNEYDGKFDLLVDTARWTAKGSWKPFKKGEEAVFNLKKQLTASEEDQYGMTFTDSLQNYITLKPDGSCTYSYLTDTTKTGQEVTIRGNYSREKNAVTVFWQKNDVFPLKSVFKIEESRPYKGEDYVEKSLKGEGRLFTQMWD